MLFRHHFFFRAFALAIFVSFAARGLTSSAESLDLSGPWRFQLDRENNGAAAEWFTRPLTSTLTLPGSLPGAGIGDPITVDTKWTGDIFDKSYYTAAEFAPYRQPGNIKVPFWLQPDTYYVGAAWFQRDLEIPASWQGRHIELLLERPHWKTTVWLDAREIGSNDSLSVAHTYDLGASVGPGSHRLTIRVDNTVAPDIGQNSHSITDHTQGNWNGIVGRIELKSTAPVWIDDVQVQPRVADRVVIVRGQLKAENRLPFPSKIHVTGGPAAGADLPAREATVAPDGSFTLDYPLEPNAPAWDEFNPILHRIVVALDNGEKCEVVFGLREMTIAGRQLKINGRTIFLRGTLECAAFPRTGHPPTDVASWKTEFRTIQAHGLNHVRFHSWCPPEAAFVAADELGIYLQIEVASWPNWSTTLGDGKPVDDWINRETARILRAYGNHASFVMLCAGNEPGGEHYTPWLAGWVARQKAADPRRLYTAGAGWPEIPENDYHVRAEPRIQHWSQGLASRINALAPETRSDYRDFIGARTAPVVSHEIGQWCVYPNFAEMAKYTGYLKPRNFEIFRASLEAHHMLEQAHDFLIASGKLQALCYKEDIESALRTPEMGGFQLLGLSDFPGQGTALVGVLDAFWEDKGYISALGFRRFCNPTVPLARLDKRVFTSDEHLTADIDVAHFGATNLSRATANWSLVADDEHIIAQGEFPTRDIPTGGLMRLGHLDLALATLPAPAHYKLTVALEKSTIGNDWDLWVYPPAIKAVAPAPANLLVTAQLDTTAETRLKEGGNVLLMIPPSHVASDPARGKIALGFSSIFWNTAWTHGQAPHTLGILCDPTHPALANFPTEAYSNWQWWYPITHASAMILDGMPAELHPIVQVIDDWVTNRKLALVFEARVGKGRLIVTSIDLNDETLDPVRRQLRASLLAYAASPRFAPITTVSVEQVRSLIAPAP
ncbi:MAG TPA: hypothetical protein VGM64_19220 [Lacunisphaera sp.]|jgi:hypothetical protein